MATLNVVIDEMYTLSPYGNAIFSNERTVNVGDLRIVLGVEFECVNKNIGKGIFKKHECVWRPRDRRVTCREVVGKALS